MRVRFPLPALPDFIGDMGGFTNSLSAKSQAGREWSRREPSDMDEAPKG
jgi:hypothetical protein